MPDEGYVPEKDELDKDMELLEEALFNGLRRGDIFTRYSDKQVVLLLPETTEEETKGIVARVAADYEGRYNGGKVHVYYETVVLK
jgi:GGDEF domain-containing protein